MTEPCGAELEAIDGQTFTCEKDRPHLIHRDGDTKFVNVAGIGIGHTTRR